MKLKITFNFIATQPTCCADTLSTGEMGRISPLLPRGVGLSGSRAGRYDRCASWHSSQCP
jgi:hypothetical protein